MNLKNKGISGLPPKGVIKTKAGNNKEAIRIYIGRYANN